MFLRRKDSGSVDQLGTEISLFKYLHNTHHHLQLYVPGKLNNVEKVIVDVGTGYFMEKDVPAAKKFYQTKVDFLKANLEKLQETITAKQSQQRLVLEVIQFKFAQFEQEKALRAKEEQE